MLGFFEETSINFRNESDKESCHPVDTLPEKPERSVASHHVFNPGLEGPFSAALIRNSTFIASQRYSDVNTLCCN